MAPQRSAAEAAAAIIEVTVETLTGSGFRLRVNSTDTVLSMKTRIQRIEGVPVGQQHLIYGERELHDSARLRDCGVRAGGRITLVVAMRGGPVNTRRLPMYEDITHAEMQQLIEMQQQSEAAWESDPPSGRQVTLLVFREGDQVSFYRVLENTDGTFSPLSDSWGSSMRNMFDEETADEMKRRIDENTATMSKMTELRHKMQQLSLKKKGRARVAAASNSTSTNTNTNTSRSRTNTAGVRSGVRLPPVAVAGPTAAPAAAPAQQHGDLGESFSRLTAGAGLPRRATRLVRAGSITTTELDSHPPPLQLSPRSPTTLPTSHTLPSSALVSPRNVSSHNSRSSSTVAAGGGSSSHAAAAARASSAAARQQQLQLLAEQRQLQLAEERQMASRGQLVSGRRRKLSLSESTDLFKQLQTQRGLERRVPLAPPPVPGRDYGAYRRTLAKLARHPSQTEQLPTPAAAAAERQPPQQPPAHAQGELPVVFESDERKGTVRRRMNSSIARPRSSPNTSLHHSGTSHQYAKDDSDPIARAVSPATPAQLRPTDGRARRLCRILSARAALHSTADSPGDSTTAATVQSAPTAPLTGDAGILDNDASRRHQNNDTTGRAGVGGEVVATGVDVKRRRAGRPRCQLCRRRLGPAAVYTCRCPGVFCSRHRYPELHRCSHDFKAEARRILERANPLVTAPKLPKI